MPTNSPARPDSPSRVMSDAEMRMRELLASVMDECVSPNANEIAFLARSDVALSPFRTTDCIIRAMLAAEAAAIERTAQVAEDACADMPSHQPVASLIATAIRSLKEGASHVG